MVDGGVKYYRNYKGIPRLINQVDDIVETGHGTEVYAVRIESAGVHEVGRQGNETWLGLL